MDFPTFQKAIAKIGVAVDESDLQDFFRSYDTNGTNTLDYKEFSDIVFGRIKIDAAASSRASQASRFDITAQYQSRGDTSYRGVKE